MGSAASFVVAFVVLRYLGVASRIFGRRYDALSGVDKTRWNEKTLSIIHAVIATQGSLRSIAQTFSEVAVGTPEYHHVIVGRGVVPHRDFYIQLSIGYFVSDLIIYALPPRHHGLPDYLHHITATLSYGVGVYFEWASFVQINFLQNEISTPLYQLTWFLRIFDLRLSRLDLCVRAVFGALFFVSRIVWNSIICWHIIVALQHESIPVPMWAYPFQLATLFLHVGLQFFWFYYIVAIFVGTAHEVAGKATGPTAEEIATIARASDESNNAANDSSLRPRAAAPKRPRD
eukprot:a509527_108.p1 GENE.a509527_108~~a509527_108.p1  ORF type:complete len:327 (-),score=86.53 a509527_108:32-895(-)